MKTKKGQIWYTDFMFGLLIFIIVVTVYYGYAHSIDQDPGEVISDIVMDAKAVSSSLITQGSPSDWNKSTVKILGITDGSQRIVQEKLEMFQNMTYQETKTKLRTSYDFFMYLEDIDGTRILINGEDGIGYDSNETDNSVTLTRLVVYNSKLTSMVVNIWE